ncbi:MAG TPA: pitrilysin family protein, partial [Polyangia bacterium]
MSGSLGPRRRLVYIVCVAACLLGAGCRGSGGARRDGEALPVDPSVHQGTLANGLRYLIRPTAGKAAFLRLAVNVGRTREGADEGELSHVVEHMAFAGSRRFPSGAGELLAKLGLRRGADANAVTADEHTTYIVDLPSSEGGALGSALGFFSEIAQHLVFPEDAIAREHAIIRAETGDRAAQHATIALYQQLDFAGTWIADRLRAHGRGDATAQAAPSREALLAFYRKWYRPDNTTLIVVGGVDTESARATIEREFGTWRPPATALPDKPSVALEAPARAAAFANVSSQEAEVYLRFTRPRRPQVTRGDHRRQLAEELAISLLGDRLARRRAERSALLRNNQVTQDRWEWPAVTNSVVATGPAAHWRELVELLAGELAMFRAEDVGFLELAAARRALLDARAASAQTPTSAADEVRRLLDAVVTGRPVLSPVQSSQLASELVKGVDGDLVDKVKAELFPRGREAILVRLPKTSVQVPSAEEILAVAAGSRQLEAAAPSQKQWTPPPFPKTAGAPVVERRKEPLDVTSLILGNGVIGNVRASFPGSRALLSLLLRPPTWSKRGASALPRAAAEILRKPSFAEVEWPRVKSYLDREGLELDTRRTTDGI